MILGMTISETVDHQKQVEEVSCHLILLMEKVSLPYLYLFSQSVYQPDLYYLDVHQVIEPVRLAVNGLASNLLAISIVPKSTSFHNSLPDLGKL